MTIFYHDDYSQITQNSGHPECPERIFAILEKLNESFPDADIRTPVPAPDEMLTLVHDAAYVDEFKNTDPATIYQEPYADTFFHDHTYEMARLAAGGALEAMKFTMENEKPGLLLARPPGHHAGPDYNGGFCYLNNGAIAAASILDSVKRVAIVDPDVHHGNGTNDIFSHDPNVLFISTHQWGIFPGTGPPDDVGTGEGEGTNVNIALPGRSGDSTFELAYDTLVMPILEEFRPEAMVINLGADAHYKDPLAGLNLSTPGHLVIIEKLLKFADRQCQNRVMITLEGGYHLASLSEVVVGTIAKMRGQMFETQFNDNLDVNERGADHIELAHGILKEYWNLG